MIAACNKAVVGDGLLPETTMGPVNNAKQLKVVTDMIAEARAKAAEVRECGQVPDEALYNGGGYFQKPALVLGADPSLSVVRDEQFGPVLPIMKFKADSDAIAMANDSDFGLCSSVWTRMRTARCGWPANWRLATPTLMITARWRRMGGGLSADSSNPASAVTWAMTACSALPSRILSPALPVSCFHKNAMLRRTACPLMTIRLKKTACR